MRHLHYAFSLSSNCWQFKLLEVQRSRQYKRSRCFFNVLEISVFEVDVVLQMFNLMADDSEKVAEVRSYLKDRASGVLNHISLAEAHEYFSFPAIEKRREDKKQALREGRTVSHPTFCELALMVGHSRRSDQQKKSAFKVC